MILSFIALMYLLVVGFMNVRLPDREVNIKLNLRINTGGNILI